MRISRYWIESEMILYNIAINNMDIVPKCYMITMWLTVPVIVVDDIILSGYKQVEGKLDRKHIMVCLKALAIFHSVGFKMVFTNARMYWPLSDNLERLYLDLGINKEIIR